MNRRRITGAAAIMICGSILLTGCQKNPDSSFVVHKDMDELIEQAKDADGNVSLTDMVDQYDTYQTTVDDDNVGVNVNVDAKVDIPQVDKMSVIRVKQKEISQDLIDKIREELMGDEQVYEGGILFEDTKSELEQQIADQKKYIKDLDVNDVNYQVSKSESEHSLSELQKQYENAPTKRDWDGNKSDGKLVSVKAKNDSGKLKQFYSWEYSLNPDGEVMYGITDGSNGEKEVLYVQNNENYGNCLRYRKSGYGYLDAYYAFVGGTKLNFNDYNTEIWDANAEKLPTELQDMGTTCKECEGETAELSGQEAKTIADEFLQKIGLTDFMCSDNLKVCERISCSKANGTEDATVPYRKEYLLRYIRNVNGAPLSYDAMGKYAEGQTDKGFVKRVWPCECIEFRINDSGIVGFDINAPLEVKETVVDKSNMKTFEEVKSTFERMIPVVYAQNGYEANTNSEYDNKTHINIDRVVLGYQRISERDSFDTGILVPVWDFFGSMSYAMGKEDSYGSMISINAIDGSVIDRELGY